IAAPISEVGHNAPQARHHRTLFTSALQRVQISLAKTIPPATPPSTFYYWKKFAGRLIPAPRRHALRQTRAAGSGGRAQQLFASAFNTGPYEAARRLVWIFEMMRAVQGDDQLRQ